MFTKFFFFLSRVSSPEGLSVAKFVCPWSSRNQSDRKVRTCFELLQSYLTLLNSYSLFQGKKKTLCTTLIYSCKRWKLVWKFWHFSCWLLNGTNPPRSTRLLEKKQRKKTQQNRLNMRLVKLLCSLSWKMCKQAGAIERTGVFFPPVWL